MFFDVIDCIIYKYTRECHIPHNRTMYARVLAGDTLFYKMAIIASVATMIVALIWIIKLKKKENE